MLDLLLAPVPVSLLSWVALCLTLLFMTLVMATMAKGIRTLFDLIGKILELEGLHVENWNSLIKAMEADKPKKKAKKTKKIAKKK